MNPKMGIEVRLQDEFGSCIESVPDPKNLLGRLLPTDSDAVLLSGIDPYGDTVFNGRQMNRFLAEWASVAARSKTQEDRDLTGRVEHLARRCRDEIHLYLAFIGD